MSCCCKAFSDGDSDTVLSSCALCCVVRCHTQAAEARRDVLHSDYTAAADKLRVAIQTEADMGYTE